MTSILLQFLAEGDAPQLVATKFESSLLDSELVCVRGKLQIGSRSTGSFLWSAGVIGAAAVLVKAKLASVSGASRDDWLIAAGLSSNSSPLAISLDYALSKQPNWLLDMFGSDSQGLPLIRRMYLRMNPERKRLGPVIVAINPSFLDPSRIKIEVNGASIEDADGLAQLLHGVSKTGTASASRISKTVRVPDSALSDVKIDGAGLTDSAIADVRRALGDVQICCPSTLPLIVRNVEAELPRLMTIRLANSLHRFLGETSKPIVGSDAVYLVPRSGLVSIRTFPNVEHPRMLTLLLDSKEGERTLLADYPIDGDTAYLGVHVVGPRHLKQIAPTLAREASLYYRQATSHLRDSVASVVRKFNPPVVDQLYGVLRRYLSASGVVEDVLKEFSIFAHIRGRARYLLDDLRYRRIQQAMRAQVGTPWMGSDLPMNRLVQTESWYSTSVVNSPDTMSYTEAVVPERTWCGTPNVWKRPIPGFGASEIAVYGMNSTWAEPLNLKRSKSAISLCAVFKDEHASALKDKFRSLPKEFGAYVSGTISELARVPVGTKAPYGHDSQVELGVLPA